MIKLCPFCEGEGCVECDQTGTGPCPTCEGKGCSECYWTGEQVQDVIQGIIDRWRRSRLGEDEPPPEWLDVEALLVILRQIRNRQLV